VISAKGAPDWRGAQILWQAAGRRRGRRHVLHSDVHWALPYRSPLRSGLYEVRASAGGAWVGVGTQRDGGGPGTESSVKVTAFRLKEPPVAAGRRVKRPRCAHGDVPVFWSDATRSGDRSEGQYLVHVFRRPDTSRRFNFRHARMETFQKCRLRIPARTGLVADASGNIWFHRKLRRKKIWTVGRQIRRDHGIHSSQPRKIRTRRCFGTGRRALGSLRRMRIYNRGALDIETGKIAEFRRANARNAHPYGMISAGRWGRCVVLRIDGGKKLGRLDPATEAIADLLLSYSRPIPTCIPGGWFAVGGGDFTFTDSGGGRLGRLTLADKKFKMWG